MEEIKKTIRQHNNQRRYTIIHRANIYGEQVIIDKHGTSLYQAQEKARSQRAYIYYIEEWEAWNTEEGKEARIILNTYMNTAPKDRAYPEQKIIADLQDMEEIQDPEDTNNYLYMTKQEAKEWKKAHGIE